MHASQTAIRNHQADKLDALRNAVLNAALPNAPDEDLQLMFVRFVDQNTAWHLKILKLYEDPWTWGQQHKIEYPASPEKVHIIEYHFPELVDKREFFELICNDLYAQSLTTVAAGNFTVSTEIPDDRTWPQQLRDHLSPRISRIGKLFLSFVESPIEDNAEAQQ